MIILSRECDEFALWQQAEGDECATASTEISIITHWMFRKLVLQLSGTSEGRHMGHPDFRVRSKIFATLGYPNEEFAAVMLTPEQQAQFVKEGSGAFVPVKGGWGLKGSTKVLLSVAEPRLVKRALSAAWTCKAITPARPRSTAAHRQPRR